MAESYNVEAILTARDEGFIAGMKAATNATDTLGNRLKKGIGFGAFMAIGGKAVSVVGNGLTDVVGTLNESSAAWKTFQGNMEMNNHTAKDIIATKKELQDFAEKTIYSASEMASTFAQLDAVGTKNTTRLVKGFGGLAAAAENPKQAMKTLSQQATQMAAKPTVQWMDFKLMLEQTPAGIAAVAKQMGMSTSQLIKNVQDGKVKTEDFFDAIAKVGTNKSFTKLAEEYKTVGQAMDGLSETAANKLQPAFNVVSGAIIKEVDGIVNVLGKVDGDKLATKVAAGMKAATPYFNLFKAAVKGVGSTISVVGGLLLKHSDTVSKVIPVLIGLIGAYKSFKIVKTLVPGITAFTKGIAGLASKGIGGIAGKLFKVSDGEKALGKTTKTTAKQMQASAKSFMMFGVGIMTIAAGFGIIAASAIALSKSGGLAIGVMFGLTAALAALTIGGMATMKAFSQTSAKAKTGAVALLALGAAVLLVSAGFALMANSAIQLAAAGTPAIACMFGMVAAVALLAAGAAALGPALTAGSVGFIAFGAAIVLVGVGAVLAAASISILSSVLPTVVQYGTQGAVAIAALGAGMIVFAVGAALAGVACVALGAGLVVAGAGLAVVGAGLLVVGAAVIVAAAGVMMLSAGVVVLGAGLTLVASAVTVAGAALPMLAAGAMAGAAGFMALMAASVALGAGLIVAGAGMTAFGALALVGVAGAVAFGVSMTACAAGTTVMAGALKLVNSSMKSIASSAKSAKSSLSGMKSSVSIVSNGLDAIGNKAKSAMSKLISSFSNASSNAKSSGQKVGNGFSTGMNSGLNKAPSIASKAVSQVASKLRSGHSAARSAGSYISQGFASGMQSCLGQIRSAASQMVAAADAAIRAKAKIHSPSRLTKAHGRYIAIGMALGIKKGISSVTSASKSLASAAINTLKKATSSRKYEDAAKSAVDKFKTSMDSKTSSTIKSLNKTVDAGVKKLQKKNPKLKKAYSQVGKILKSDISKTIKDQGKKAISATDKALTALGKKYQEKYDKIASDRDNYLSKLSDYGSLYSVDSYGFVALTDFNKQKSQVQSLSKNMEHLKKVLPYDLLRDIQDLDTSSALSYTNELLKKGDTWLKQYGKDYSSFISTAKSESNKYYNPYITQLDKDFNSAVSAELSKLKKQLNTIGSQATAGFVKGLTSKSSKKALKKAASDLASILTKTVKGKLKIHSPSRVFISLAKYVGLGMVKGLDSMAGKVANAMDNLVTIPSVATPVLSGVYGGELSADYEYYRNAQYTIVVPVEMDGKEVARVTAPYTEAELNKRQARENRKRGRR